MNDCIKNHIVDKIISKHKCYSCEYKYLRAYIKSLIFPENFFQGFGDGLLTSKIRLKGFDTVDLNTSYGTYVFKIAINFVTPNSTTSGNILLHSGDLGLTGGTLGTVTRKGLDIDTTLYNFYFTTATSYRVVSASVKTSYTVSNKNDGGLGVIDLLQVIPKLIGSVSYETTMDTSVYNSFQQSFANKKHYMSTNEAALKLIYIPSSYPPPFQKYDTTTINTTAQKHFLATTFEIPYYQSSRNNDMEIFIDITQNIEIIQNLEPFFSTPNPSWNYELLEKFVKKNIEDEFLIISIPEEYTSSSNFFNNSKIIKQIEQIGDIKECCCSDDDKKFITELHYLKGLPKTINFIDCFYVCKNLTFELTLNALGNSLIAINPYILWRQNNTARSGGTMLLRPFQYSTDANLNFYTPITFTVNSSLADGNSLFATDVYLESARLVKGEITIPPLYSKINNSDNGNFFAGFSPYYERYNGTTSYNNINTNELLNIEFYRNLNKIQYFKEIPAANGLKVFIPPDFWNNYKFNSVAPDVVTNPNGFLTNWVIFGTRNILNNSGTPSKIRVNMTLIYETNFNLMTNNKKFAIYPQYINERFTFSEINHVMDTYLNEGNTFIMPYLENKNSITNEYKNYVQENNYEKKLEKLKLLYNKY